MKIPKEIILMLANGRKLNIELEDAKFISPILIEAKIKMSTKFLRSHLEDCIKIKFKKNKK